MIEASKNGQLALDGAAQETLIALDDQNHRPTLVTLSYRKGEITIVRHRTIDHGLDLSHRTQDISGHSKTRAPPLATGSHHEDDQLPATPPLQVDLI